MAIVIPDQKTSDTKIEIIKKGGAKSLHVITDCDRTLTKDVINKKKLSISYSPLYSCLKGAAHKRLVDLFNYYQPIEDDPSFSEEEKIKKMTEWWDKAFDLIVEQRVRESDFRKEADKLGLPFRKGVTEFFDLLKQNNIPLLIFSAGMTNAIEFYLKKMNVISNNVHIVSNKLIIKNGKVVGYSKPLIHVFNKDERHVKNAKYKLNIAKRKNVILIGDSLGDLTMSNGISHDCILRVGFLNKNIERDLSIFKKKFDIIITGDGEFTHINKILGEALG